MGVCGGTLWILTIEVVRSELLKCLVEGLFDLVHVDWPDFARELHDACTSMFVREQQRSEL